MDNKVFNITANAAIMLTSFILNHPTIKKAKQIPKTVLKLH